VYVTEYINRTLTLRDAQVQQGNPKPTQLFFSWATKKPVTRPTVARWLKTTLGLAGIDTKQFSAHSYRGAGLSAAHSRGASIEKIMSFGNWKNADTFRSYYCAPDQDSPIGKMILSHFESGELYNILSE
jgi:site-specific recombinase XerD